MPVTFVLGRAGAGKTRYCVDAVQAALRAPQMPGRLILLVPEQASFQMERTLSVGAPGGGYTRAEVLSFSRLAQHVFSATGVVPQVLSTPARRLLLRRTARHVRDELTILHAALSTPGFYGELDSLIAELLRAAVSSAALRDAAAAVDDDATRAYLRDIATLYDGYLRCLGPDVTDAAAGLALARARFAEIDWLGAARVWVDGFAGFTGQEIETLVALAGCARDVTITLLLDPASDGLRDAAVARDPLRLFHRTEHTYHQLRERFAQAGIAVAEAVRMQPTTLPRFDTSDGLAALEAGLATPAHLGSENLVKTTSADVRIVECASPREELQAAARWIRSRIVDAGGALKYRDFAVIARDLAPYADHVADLFPQYGIPYFLDRHRSIGSHPVTRLVDGVFDALGSDLDGGPMVALLRTGLLPVTRAQAEELENVVLRHAVRGRQMWREERWELEQPLGTIEACVAERLRIVGALTPLATLFESSSPASAAEWARAVFETLTRLGADERIGEWIRAAQINNRWEAAETHRLAWDTLMQILDELHDLLANTPLTTSEVRDILLGALRERTLALAPPAVDQVLVSAIERSRHPDVRHAWVLGFNEGVFPAPPGDDALLSARQRNALVRAGLAGIESRQTDAFAERMLAYIALTRPSQSLTISYAAVDEQGEALLPSRLLGEVERVFPKLSAEAFAPTSPAVSVHELVEGVLREAGPEDAWRRRCRSLAGALQSDPALGVRLQWLQRGVHYSNELDAIGRLAQSAEMVPGCIWRCSPSEIETYVQCPFKHFAKYGLNLDAQRAPRPLRWDLGSAAHELLADVTRHAMQRGDVRTLADADWMELLDDAIARADRSRPPKWKERRPDHVFQSAHLHALLRDVVRVHAERWRRGQFAPAQCEAAFGVDDARALKGGRIDIDAERWVATHGSIDRVDICASDDGTFVLVYDYKSRASTIRKRTLTGHRLQILLYLRAAVQAGGGRYVPGGVFLAPLYPDLSALTTKYVASAEDPAQTMYLLRPYGLFTEAAARRLDRQLDRDASPVARMQLKKDGGFYASSDVSSADELEAYLELARKTVCQAAEGVARGAVTVAPLVESNRLACANCDYAAVCRFDRALNTPRTVEGALPQLELPGTAGGDDEAD